MATTPPEKKAPPPPTPGFTAALFGIFSTAKKKPRLVDSSTVPMASVTRTTRVPHRRPEISLQSPSENESASTDKIVTTSAIDLLDTDVPSASPEPQKGSSTLYPHKSPWKSPSVSAMNGSKSSGLEFSIGNLKAPPSERRSSLSQKPRTFGRRKYSASRLLVAKNRDRTSTFNSENAVNALQGSQNLFEPSREQVEKRNNYTSIREGRRLRGSSQRGGSRLPPAVDDEALPPPTVGNANKKRKQKQVMFGDAVDATPVESEVVTPTGQKRKGTPFKATISDVDASPQKSEASTPSRKPSIGPRPQTKLLLEKRNYDFEESGEARHLGSPESSRTPRFLEIASMMLRLPLDPAPSRTAKRFKGQAATPSVKETSKPAAIDTFLPGSAVKTRAASFKCHECQAESSIEQSKCSKCGAAKQVVTSGWGDLFADQKTRWKCAVCSVQNDQSATECAACETPRDGKESKAPTSSSKDAPRSKASIGASGFSFGSGSTVPATSTGGFTFGSQSAPPKSVPSKDAGFSLASATSSASKGQGFTFGAAPTSTTTGTSFTFGASTTSSTASSGGGFKFDSAGPSTSGGNSGGGFSFGSFPASATDKEKSKTSTGNGTSTSTLAQASSSSAPSSIGSSSKSLAENETKTPLFKFASTSSSQAETENRKPAGFSFASSTPAVGVGNGAAKAFEFNTSNDEKKSEDALSVKPNFAFHSSSSSSPKMPQVPIPGAEPADKAGPPANGSSVTFPMSNINKSDLNKEATNKPVFSFGNSGGTATNSSTGFSFGGTPAPAAPTTASTFNFSAPSAASTDKGVVPLGSITNRDDTDDDRSKRRRERENDVASSAPTFGGAAAATQVPTPAFTFGSSAPAPTTFGSQPQSDANAIGFGSSIPSSTAGGFSFSAAPAPAASSTFKFGDSANASTPAFGSDSISTEKPSAPLFGQSAPSTAPSFGSSQALVPSFGSAAPAPASSSNPFGSTAAAAASSFSFGSAPAPSFASTPAPSFGSTSASAPSFGSTSAPAPSFGSTSAPAPSFGSTSANPPSFGSTSTPAPSFGSTSTPAPTFGSTSAPAPSFGSTPAQAPAPLFGSTPAPAPMFGSTPGTSLTQFGSAPTPSVPGFGVASAPVPQVFSSTLAAPFGATPADASFGSAASSGPSFGAAPASFGAAPAPFGSVAGSFGGAAPGQQSFGFGGAESGPGGFVSPAGFGNQGGFSTPGAEPVQFSIGTGGSNKSAMRGRRPLMRAKRPTSGR